MMENQTKTSRSTRSLTKNLDSITEANTLGARDNATSIGKGVSFHR